MAAKTPVLRADGKVEFESAEALREHYDTFLSQGGVLVRADRPPAAFATIELMLLSPSSPDTLAAKAQACAVSEAGVFFRFVEFGDALKAELKAFAERPPTLSRAGGDSGTGATPAPGPQPARAVALPDTGRFKNPALPQDFLALPLVRSPTPEQQASPPMPLLLQALAGRTGPCTRLVARAGGNKHVELFFTPGAPVQFGVPAKAVVAALAEQNGSYELSSVAAPQLHYSLPMGELQCAVIKELVKRYVEPDLRAAMAGRMGQSPKLGPTAARLLKRFSLSEAQNRIALRMLTGAYALDEVLYTGIGVRSTFQVLYLLEATGALEWADPPPKSSVLLDELKATLDRIRGADHFDAGALPVDAAAADRARLRPPSRDVRPRGRGAARVEAARRRPVGAHGEGLRGGEHSGRAQGLPQGALPRRAPRLRGRAHLRPGDARRAALRLAAVARPARDSSAELNPLAEYAAAYRRVQEKRRLASKPG